MFQTMNKGNRQTIENEDTLALRQHCLVCLRKDYYTFDILLLQKNQHVLNRWHAHTHNCLNTVVRRCF